MTNERLLVTLYAVGVARRCCDDANLEQSPSQIIPYALIGIIALFGLGPTKLFGEPAGCVLVADEGNPAEKILRCGDGATIRNAANTS